MSAKCHCSDWDNESPCPQHNPKLEQPSMVEHQCLVARIYRRRSSRRWFYTLTKDAVQIFVSDDMPQRPKLLVIPEELK